MAKLCEHGYFLEVAPRSCPKCRTDLDLIQREEISTLKATISRLRAELAEWRKDAERYRWLRDKCRDGSLTIARADDWSLHPWSGDDIDKEIDAARKGEETT